MIVDTATQYGIFVQKLFKKGGNFLFIIFLLKQVLRKSHPGPFKLKFFRNFCSFTETNAIKSFKELSVNILQNLLLSDR